MAIDLLIENKKYKLDEVIGKNLKQPFMVFPSIDCSTPSIWTQCMEQYSYSGKELTTKALAL